MRLRPKIILTTLAIAAVPLGAAGYGALRFSESSLRARAAHLHRTVAHLLAEKLADEIQTRIQAVRLAANAYLFDTMSPEEVRGALRLVFRQVDRATAVALFDDEGNQLALPVFLSARVDDPELGSRPALTAEDLARFGDHVPFSAALRVGAALGPPYLAVDGTPRVAVAVRAENVVLAVELTMVGLLERISGAWLDDERRAFVADDQGRVILDADAEAVASREDRSGWGPLKRLQGGLNSESELIDPILGPSLGSAARVPGLQWVVVAAESSSAALEAVELLRSQLLIGVAFALFLGAALGIASARKLIQPLITLHTGAAALARGELGHRVGEIDRRDELGDVARAFNVMADEVERWNVELEDRVEQKTHALKEAQSLLIRAQKMAAVGQLGAGVAHEINNPLAGILGMAQLLLVTAEEGSKRKRQLTQIHEQAKRIQEIVERLKKLTDEGDRTAVGAADVRTVLDSSLELFAEELERNHITVVREFDAAVPNVSGDPTRLREAFTELFSNAQRAMPEGGVLTVGLRGVEGQLVSVRIADTGPGIPKELQSRVFEPFFTTKKDWNSKGLGLSLVNKIVEDHQGAVTLESEPGAGAAFVIALPAATRRSLQ